MTVALPTIHEHEPLAHYVAWRIGGPARFFATATTADELRDLVLWGREQELPLFVLGGGSNILVSDAGFPGLVIRNRAHHHTLERRGDDVRLRIEAGAPMAGTSRQMAAQGLTGLVWSEGLPGTVGGAIYGNAGCYGGDMAGILHSATVLLPDGTTAEWSVGQFEYGYRTSVLKAHAAAPTAIVLAAELTLYRDDPVKLGAEIAVIAAARKAKTPSGSSCGSSFKNPPGDSAGRLLEVAGLKGTQIGGAQVSSKHANYIVNLGGATAGDVLRLTDLMRERVVQRLGTELELEVQIVGASA
ncbi:MAG: UDP-N-acetylmuramate dehydrogenase [Herpetosiphonaceae bacterium]|nr:UDP-N-acetylmuramate dehydrogenase [Herpetosiphonaceae bacterium]